MKEAKYPLLVERVVFVSKEVLFDEASVEGHEHITDHQATTTDRVQPEDGTADSPVAYLLTFGDEPVVTGGLDEDGRGL